MHYVGEYSLDKCMLVFHSGIGSGVRGGQVRVEQRQLADRAANAQPPGHQFRHRTQRHPGRNRDLHRLSHQQLLPQRLLRQELPAQRHQQSLIHRQQQHPVHLEFPCRAPDGKDTTVHQLQRGPPRRSQRGRPPHVQSLFPTVGFTPGRSRSGSKGQHLHLRLFRVDRGQQQ